MTYCTRRILAPMLAAFILAAGVGLATANSLSASTQRIRVIWWSLELANTVNEEVVRCPVTLEGSLNTATVAKRANATIGSIIRARVANSECTGGHATIHTESLPWSVLYDGFTGTLPRITGVKIELLRVFFEISVSGNTCSSRTEGEHPAVGIIGLNEATGEDTGLRPEEATRIPLTNGSGGIFCGLASGIFRGTSEPITQPDPAMSISLI